MSKNLPPGVSDSDIPGNRPEDERRLRKIEKTRPHLDELETAIFDDLIEMGETVESAESYAHEESQIVIEEVNEHNRENNKSIDPIEWYHNHH